MKNFKALINEVMTQGVANGLKKPKVVTKILCPACRRVIPKYPGKYSKSCPWCGVDMVGKDATIDNK